MELLFSSTTSSDICSLLVRLAACLYGKTHLTLNSFGLPGAVFFNAFCYHRNRQKYFPNQKVINEYLCNYCYDRKVRATCPQVASVVMDIKEHTIVGKPRQLKQAAPVVHTKHVLTNLNISNCLFRILTNCFSKKRHLNFGPEMLVLLNHVHVF